MWIMFGKEGQAGFWDYHFHTPQHLYFQAHPVSISIFCLLTLHLSQPGASPKFLWRSLVVAKDEVVGHMGLAFLINVYVYLRRLLGGMSEIMEERAKTLKNLGATKANFQKEFLLSLYDFIYCSSIHFSLDYILTTLLKLLYLGVFYQLLNLIYSWVYFWILFSLPLMYLFTW